MKDCVDIHDIINISAKSGASKFFFHHSIWETGSEECIIFHIDHGINGRRFLRFSRWWYNIPKSLIDMVKNNIEHSEYNDKEGFYYYNIDDVHSCIRRSKIEGLL